MRFINAHNAGVAHNVGEHYRRELSGVFAHWATLNCSLVYPEELLFLSQIDIQDFPFFCCNTVDIIPEAAIYTHSDSAGWAVKVEIE
jgi:hypothetical protein